MRNKYTWVTVLLFLTHMSWAQQDFREGYIIHHNRDTIYGEIDYRGANFMSTQCVFRSSSQEKTNYSPNDIAAFRFINSKYFVAKEIEGKKLFLEYLVKGVLSFYYVRQDLVDR